MQRVEVGGRTVVLLTGFGPFPTVPRNATQWLVPHLAHHARRTFPDVHFEAVIVPTSWDEAPQHIAHMIAAIAPDVSLHFGVSGRAKGFEFETRAFNTTAEIADATGRKFPPKPLVRRGAELRVAQFPAHDIVVRLKRRGIPAVVSRDAGRYLCNAVLYHALHTLRDAGCMVRCGFVHMPTRLASNVGFGHDRPPPEQFGTHLGPLPRLPRHAPRSPLTWDQAIIGGLETIAVCLGRALPPNHPSLLPSSLKALR